MNKITLRFFLCISYNVFKMRTLIARYLIIILICFVQVVNLKKTPKNLNFSRKSTSKLLIFFWNSMPYGMWENHSPIENFDFLRIMDNKISEELYQHRLKFSQNTFPRRRCDHNPCCYDDYNPTCPTYAPPRSESHWMHNW